MKNIIFVFLFFLCSQSCPAQYYYQDIYSTQQVNTKHQLYKKAGVDQLQIKSFNPFKIMNKGFLVTRNISDNFLKITSTSLTQMNGRTHVSSYYDSLGRIIESSDSSENSQTITTYQYDSSGSLHSIVFLSNSDTGSKNPGFMETHHYYYNSSGKLIKMIRDIGMGDSSSIIFSRDSLGRIIQEVEFKGERQIQNFHYQYDPLGNLTDIYHYVPFKSTPLPDFMFDYNQKNQLIKMLTIKTDSKDYHVWKYQYNEKGLPTQESCFDRGKVLLGDMEYFYHYR